MNNDFLLESREQLDHLLTILRDAVESGTHRISVRPIKKQRTIPQNKSLHLYASKMAKGMNQAGITQRELTGKFKEGFELPVTESMIKDVFREVGKAMYQKESTADLSSKEICEVYKVVDQRFGEVTGVRHEWPSKEVLILRSM